MLITGDSASVDVAVSVGGVEVPKSSEPESAGGGGGGGALLPEFEEPPFEAPVAAFAMRESSCALVRQVSAPLSSDTHSFFVLTSPAKNLPIPFDASASHCTTRVNRLCQKLSAKSRESGVEDAVVDAIVSRRRFISC